MLSLSLKIDHSYDLDVDRSFDHCATVVDPRSSKLLKVNRNSLLSSTIKTEYFDRHKTYDQWNLYRDSGKENRDSDFSRV